MSCESLGQFVEQLSDAGLLVRISAEVGSMAEVAEIPRRVCHSGGPALLIERLTGTEQQIVTNLYGSDRRISLALGADDYITKPFSTQEQEVVAKVNEMLSNE